LIAILKSLESPTILTVKMCGMADALVVYMVAVASIGSP
jgi:hypothetical protein